MSNLRRPHSGILISSPAAGGPSTTQATLSCIHCSYTWLPRPGSGRVRGWCGNCCGYLCGRPTCVANGCVHREQVLQNLEDGRPEWFKPIIVSVPAAPPR